LQPIGFVNKNQNNNPTNEKRYFPGNCRPDKEGHHRLNRIAGKGREIYYQLEIDKMKEIDKWIEQFRKIWETRFNQLDDLLATIKKQKK